MKHPRRSNLLPCLLAQLALVFVLAFMFVAQAGLPLFMPKKADADMAALRQQGQSIVADVQSILSMNVARAGGVGKEALMSGLEDACAKALQFTAGWSIDCAGDPASGEVAITATHAGLGEPVRGVWKHGN
ncbi:MAG: hypothetical protein LDL30_07120 [Desulfovibrio sp.]|nr:hypothetical protein [Desulfovibrio sp.]MCA1985596.1 hypothetical protein [Desulfovibrio sp.]